MLSLNEKMSKVTGVNLRSERHGDNLVPAFDVGISIDVPNTQLDQFDTQLREAFFMRDESVAEDMLDGHAHLPLLKFPGFPPVKWATNYEGYQLVVHYGIEGSEVKLPDSKIKTVAMTFKEGGTVNLSFQVQTHPAENSTDVAKLHSLIQKEVQITLVPPDEKKQYEIAQAKAEQRQKLEDQFKPPVDNQTGNLLNGEENDD